MPACFVATFAFLDELKKWGEGKLQKSRKTHDA
jgi:hypothetical protein